MADDCDRPILPPEKEDEGPRDEAGGSNGEEEEGTTDEEEEEEEGKDEEEDLACMESSTEESCSAATCTAALARGKGRDPTPASRPMLPPSAPTATAPAPPARRFLALAWRSTGSCVVADRDVVCGRAFNDADDVIEVVEDNEGDVIEVKSIVLLLALLIGCSGGGGGLTQATFA